jgi:hypothetical protein
VRRGLVVPHLTPNPTDHLGQQLQALARRSSHQCSETGKHKATGIPQLMMATNKREIIEQITNPDIFMGHL